VEPLLETDSYRVILPSAACVLGFFVYG